MHIPFSMGCALLRTPALFRRDQKGIACFLTRDDPKWTSIILPVAFRLRQLGWEVREIGRQSLSNYGDPDFEPDEHMFSKPQDTHIGKTHVLIDINKNTIQFDGINYFNIFWHTTIKRIHKYDLNLSNVEEQAVLLGSLKDALNAHRLCVAALDEAQSKSIPVRFWGWEPNYVPSGILKHFSHVHNESNVNFVEITAGKEFYDSEAITKDRRRRIKSLRKIYGRRYNLPLERISAKNVTALDLPNAISPAPSQFQDWYREFSHNYNEAAGDQSSLIDELNNFSFKSNSNFSNSLSDVELRLSVDLIKENIVDAKNKGKKIVCIFGSTLIDLNHIYRDEGFVHSDMMHWISSTCEMASRLKSTHLFIVKAHPFERGLKRRKSVNFLNYIEEYEDILIIPRNFSTEALVSDLDLAVSWRGTVTVELGRLGARTLALSPFFIGNSVLPIPKPRSVQEYENWLEDPCLIPYDEDFSRICGAVLDYYKNIDLINVDWATIPRKNVLGAPSWNLSKISNLFFSSPESIEKLLFEFLRSGR